MKNIEKKNISSMIKITRDLTTNGKPEVEHKNIRLFELMGLSPTTCIERNQVLFKEI